MNDAAMIDARAHRRGAVVMDDGTRFAVWAPKSGRVAVRLYDAAGATAGEYALADDGRGVFTGVVPGVGPGRDYRFVLDDGAAYPDPVSRSQPGGVHGPSRVVDPGTFRWTDAAWRAPAMADYVLYELHVGTFTPEGTFDAVIPHLAALRALGVTAVELMPVAQFPGTRNWGYDGTFPYAPQNSYGGPDGLRRLVDAAHATGLAVALDVVYNHLGPEGNYLGAFAPYFTDVYHTPWGAAVNYDGPDSGEVRRYVIDNAVHWITEYHLDALRLDAIHGIYDFGARHLLTELTARVHATAAALGRTVCLIAESDLNDPRVVRPAGACGYGFDAQWSDDLHHALHAALTQERRGYYADFGGVGPVAAALLDPFVYQGGYSRHRRRRHGAPAAGISRDHFVVCAQNHDQVGNRAAGERLTTLVPPAAARLAAAVVLLAPYVPLLFMGEEYGETHPFQYFVSHGDPALLDAVRRGRRAEFESFGWGDAVPDPADEQTFRRSTLDHAAARTAAQAARRALFHDLLRCRASEPALRPGDADVTASGGEQPRTGAGGWIAMTLRPRAGGRPLVALFNFAEEPRTIPLPEIGPHTVLLGTDDPRYADPTDPTDCTPRGAGTRISTDGAGAVLPPCTAALVALVALGPA